MDVPFKIYMLGFEQLEQNIAQTVEKLAKNEMSLEESSRYLITLFRAGVKKGAKKSLDLVASDIGAHFAHVYGGKEPMSSRSLESLEVQRYLNDLRLCK